MTELIVIHPPLVREFDAVLDLRYRVLDEPVGLPRKSEPGAHDRDPQSIHMAAFVGQTIVSTVRFDRNGDESYLVRRMATDPSYQGQGIGRQVMQAAEEVAARRGVRRIVLHARIGAVPFYERLGYMKTGNIEIHNGDENPEMIKLI